MLFHWCLFVIIGAEMNDLREQLDNEQRQKKRFERQKESALQDARVLAHELREDDKAVKRALKTHELKQQGEKVGSSDMLFNVL